MAKRQVNREDGLETLIQIASRSGIGVDVIRYVAKKLRVRPAKPGRPAWYGEAESRAILEEVGRMRKRLFVRYGFNEKGGQK